MVNIDIDKEKDNLLERIENLPRTTNYFKINEEINSDVNFLIKKNGKKIEKMNKIYENEISHQKDFILKRIEKRKTLKKEEKYKNKMLLMRIKRTKSKTIDFNSIFSSIINLEKKILEEKKVNFHKKINSVSNFIENCSNFNKFQDFLKSNFSFINKIFYFKMLKEIFFKNT